MTRFCEFWILEKLQVFASSIIHIDNIVKFQPSITLGRRVIRSRVENEHVVILKKWRLQSLWQSSRRIWHLLYLELARKHKVWKCYVPLNMTICPGGATFYRDKITSYQLDLHNFMQFSQPCRLKCLNLQHYEDKFPFAPLLVLYIELYVKNSGNWTLLHQHHHPLFSSLIFELLLFFFL